jgi:hypothetical protein
MVFYEAKTQEIQTYKQIAGKYSVKLFKIAL